MLFWLFRPSKTETPQSRGKLKIENFVYNPGAKTPGLRFKFDRGQSMPCMISALSTTELKLDAEAWAEGKWGN